jgi:hypothetical protein
MYACYRSTPLFRRMVAAASLVLLLCVALGACGAAPASSSSSSSTSNPLSAPSGGGGSSGSPAPNIANGGGGVPKPTITPTPAKLAAAPTQLQDWTNNCPPTTLVTHVQLSNTGYSVLNWSIGSASFTPGPTTMELSPTSGTLAHGTYAQLTVQASLRFLDTELGANGKVISFEIVGQSNTVRIIVAGFGISGC